MIKANTTLLTLERFKEILPDDIIYGEVTSPKGMGNTGGIMLYVLHEDAFVLYISNIEDDEKLFYAVEEFFEDNICNNRKTMDHLDHQIFQFIGGGLGTSSYKHKEVDLEVEEDFFVFKEEGKTYQIYCSVEEVFHNTARMLQNS
ncbi:MAG TPA: hypothetical protein VFD78_03140 [Chitinophagaceae bacterium]|nr:hypothetical protein [Chitinophagaceae bacterium]